MTLNLFHFNIAKAAYAKDGKIFKERIGISFTHKSKRIKEICFIIVKKWGKWALNKRLWYNVSVKKRFSEKEALCFFTVPRRIISPFLGIRRMYGLEGRKDSQYAAGTADEDVLHRLCHVGHCDPCAA